MSREGTQSWKLIARPRTRGRAAPFGRGPSIDVPDASRPLLKLPVVAAVVGATVEAVLVALDEVRAVRLLVDRRRAPARVEAVEPELIGAVALRVRTVVVLRVV